MAPPPPFSSLASKPPQNPSTAPTTSTNTTSSPPPSPSGPAQAPPSRPPPSRSPSSHNYAAALANAKVRAAQSPTSPGIYKPLGKLGSAATSATSASANGSDSTAPTSSPISAEDDSPKINPRAHTAAKLISGLKANAVKLTTSTGKHTGTITPPVGRVVDVGRAEGKGEGEGEGEGEKGTRPGVERMQSWSEQDMKRVMQERLLRGEGAGFSKGGRG